MSMKKISSLIFVIALLPSMLSAAFLFGAPLVRAIGNQPASLDQVVKEITDAQGAKDSNSIDCTKATEAQLEELGDAVMEKMHPGDQHELMDKMMGGEGSASLKAAHIALGQRYLGCGNNSGYGMMGGYGLPTNNNNRNAAGWTGMMGGNDSYSMMGGYGNFGFHWFWPILFLLLIIMSVIILMKWLAGINKTSGAENRAKAILKERYAKGEINQEQFEQMKKELS